MSDRAALAERVRALREQGLTWRAVAGELGISSSYASQLHSDPDGTKTRARKDSYGGECEVCGKRTDGSNGPKSAPKLCAACTRQRQHDERHWTAERVLAAIREYHDRYGHPPVASDILRLRPGPWFPAVGSVQREFGTWNKGVEAAGFTPLPRYRTPVRRNGMAGYVVFKQNGAGFIVAGRVGQARTQQEALRLWLAENEGDHGVLAAVPEGSWKPRRVRLVMRPSLEWDDA